MRILIITQYYYPENFRSSDIGEELAKRGHHVDALVGIPNYPEGKYYQGYGFFKKRHELINGVNVYRCFQIPRGKEGSHLRLSLNYLSYVISACLWILFKFSFKKKYDAIVVFEVSPITQVIPAVLLSKLTKTPVYTWVLDIWPDSVLSTFEGREPKLLFQVLTVITEFAYRHSYKIMVSSKGMEKLVCRNADYHSKLIYFPNWCDDILSMPIENSIALPDGYIIMMAGNLATSIGISSVVDLVQKLSDVPNLHFVFVGGGTKAEYMSNEFKKRNLNNVLMTGRLPFSAMPALYKRADAMLITYMETDVPHYKATVPLRLQSYMSAAKPILGMIDGCASEIIKYSGCGYCVDAGDVESLAQYIKDNILANPSEFSKKGEKSRHYFEEYYQKSGCIDNLEYYLKKEGSDEPPYNVPIV